MNPQDINVNRLETLGIYELRELGRRVGVTRPTALRREELVAGIKECLKHGEIQKSPVRGRKPRSLSVDFSKIIDSDGFDSCINSALSQVFEPQVRDGISGDSRVVSGYMHLLPSGSAVLVGTDLNGYPVSGKVLRTYSLKTGDYIDGRAVYNAARNSFVIEEVAQKSESIRFDEIGGVRPCKACTSDFLMGERVLVVTPKPFDRLSQIVKLSGEIKDAHKIALLVDETDDSAKFLKGCGVQDIYLSKVNYNIQKQTVACLLALFRAKELASQGNNVVLFVDSLNKLFKIYNNSTCADGRIDPSFVNLAPFADLKSFVVSSRALENCGSLSVIGFLNNPGNPVEEYIYNEFADLAHKIIRK